MRLSVPRSHFNELAREGKVRHWREAFQSGTVKATGPAEILKLIQNVVEKQEERGRTRKLRDQLPQRRPRAVARIRGGRRSRRRPGHQAQGLTARPPGPPES